MKKNTVELIVRIEDYMNSRNIRTNESLESTCEEKGSCTKILSMLDDNKKKKIDEYLNEFKTAKTQPEYVCEKMPGKGFVYDDGQLNFVKFYNHARINPDVWHTFITQKHKPSEDTMFKIVFALQLDEEDADYFLSLGGCAFEQSNPLHKYVLACINTKIYDPDEVYEVLDFYKVHNIYTEKKSRKDCK